MMADDGPSPSAPPLEEVGVGVGRSDSVDRRGAWAEADRRILHDQEIALDEPTMHGSLGTRHVTFRITVQPVNYVVRRRYSDFLWLYNTLVKRYRGLLIPPLPPKTMQATMEMTQAQESSVILNRMLMLKRFLDSVCTVPFLRSDPSLQAFLSMDAGDEWAAAKAEADAGGVVECEGLRLWNTAIKAQGDPPIDAEQQLVAFGRHLDHLREILKQMEAKARPACDRGFQQLLSLGALVDFLPEWVRAEGATEGGPTGQGAEGVAITNRYGVECAQVLSDGHGNMERWLELKRRECNELSNTVYCGILMQLQTVEAMRVMIKKRDKLSKEVARLRHEIIKTEREISQAQAGGRGSPSRFTLSGIARGQPQVPLSQLLTEMSAAFDENKSQLDGITAGLLGGEIDRFHSERLTQCESLFDDLARSQVMNASRMTELWSPILAARNSGSRPFGADFAGIAVAGGGGGGGSGARAGTSYGSAAASATSSSANPFAGDDDEPAMQSHQQPPPPPPQKAAPVYEPVGKTNPFDDEDHMEPVLGSENQVDSIVIDDTVGQGDDDDDGEVESV